MPTGPSVRITHPLEIIALFRRWPRSALRDLVYTALWSTLIALGLALATSAVKGSTRNLGYMLGTMTLTANIVGFLIHGGLAFLRLVAPGPFTRRTRPMLLLQVLLMACCVMLGLALADTLIRGVDLVAALLHGGALAPLVPVGAATALLMVVVLTVNARREARGTEAARQQEKIAEAGRLLAEARLRALQAQIEPHFLYNTLANVVSLIGPAPEQARHMLERLIDFLRASLSASRAEQATVGAELDLAGAYLDVLAVRLGARLRYRIELDPACRLLPIAPMLIQPLVENAIMHGIEPEVAGGEIVLRARRTEDALCIEISDDGAGLGSTTPRPGGGVGLANLRERLRSLHGINAQVQLLENQAGGVTSRLLLPLVFPAMEPPSTPSAP